MYKHQGKKRTFKHNLKIATVLSFVAGLVNVTGFLYIGQLTTNVTGHLALFMNDILRADFWRGFVYLFYIISFLAGSIFSGFIMDWNRRVGKENILQTPLIIESIILIGLPLICYYIFDLNPDLMACILLFSMGMQNSYVTSLSGAIVRTTHLTGLFTDLGIEISQLFFVKLHPNTHNIKAMIRLRIRIISSFFIGGILGGLFYFKMSLGLNTLILGGVALVISMLYDSFSHK
jgi:uncharacterized membrane protein YoaK (UPF0700 family)